MMKKTGTKQTKDNYSTKIGTRTNERHTYQRVTIVAHENENVDGGRVVGHADAVLRLVLLVVIGDDSRYGPGQYPETHNGHVPVQLLLELARLTVTYKGGAQGQPPYLRTSDTSTREEATNTTRHKSP